jgi:hypothetical protein
LARELARFWTSQVRLLRPRHDSAEAYFFDSRDVI